MALLQRVPALAALPARHAAVHAADGPRLAQVPQDDAEPHAAAWRAGSRRWRSSTTSCSTSPARTTWWRTRSAGAAITQRSAAERDTRRARTSRSVSRSRTPTRSRRWQRARTRAQPPEPQEQRQRNIDAATKVLPRAADAPPPNKAGHDRDADAALLGQHQARRAVCAAHGGGAPVLEPPAARHRRARAAVVGAGRRARPVRGGHGGLPTGHRIPYTGDAIALRDDEDGGPYVLQTKRGAGIDAARRNCGLGRWVNDPRGAMDEQGRAREANCEFVLHTPRGGGQRIAAVRTLRPILRGEELLVRYGGDYWRFHAAAAEAAAEGQAGGTSTAAGAPQTAAGAAGAAVDARRRTQHGSSARGDTGRRSRDAGNFGRRQLVRTRRARGRQRGRLSRSGARLEREERADGAGSEAAEAAHRTPPGRRAPERPRARHGAADERDAPGSSG